MLNQLRNCPLCYGSAGGVTFPYATHFNDVRFDYLKCASCKSVFVDPVPDSQTFNRMYAKSAYHDLYYDGGERADYSESAMLLRGHLQSNSTVLDYGCGVGGFLKACAAQGFVPFGVEFDSDAAKFAAHNAKCVVMPVEVFNQLDTPPSFDAIHMGDVLEHLPNPAATLKELLGFLKPSGVLFIEGPLEVNPSPVFWAARIFGVLKRQIRPKFMARHAPTHLFRVDANAQSAFFAFVDTGLSIRYWQVYETGWPYVSGGLMKRIVAAIAKLIGGKKLVGVTFGNRFKAILVKA